MDDVTIAYIFSVSAACLTFLGALVITNIKSITIKRGKMDTGERFFFDKDGDGHWYMIPVRLAAEWNNWVNADHTWEGGQDEIWSEYMIDGDPCDYHFSTPTNEWGDIKR